VSITPGEQVTGLAGAERINDALMAFVGCVGMAVPDICSYGLTIGDSYVPFDPDEDEDCDEEDVVCSQVWVRVADVVPSPSEGWDSDCATVMVMTLEVGVLRCIEIKGKGEAPTASEVMLAAMQAMSDMNVIYCAAMACEVWAAIDSGSWNPLGPDGGQYGGTWTFTVEV
jgi:hypothetical protein